MVYCMVLLSVILFVFFVCPANLPLMMLKIIYPHLCVLLNQFLNLVLIDDMISAYEEVVYWKHGKARKVFVRELTKLYQAHADNSALLLY